MARPFAAVALVATAVAAVGLRPTGVSAAPPNIDGPTRLYMLPADNSAVIPDLLAGLAIPIGTMTFDDVPLGGDVISRQSRVITFESAEVAPCNIHGTDGTGSTGSTSDDFSLTGCTAVQLGVGHGELSFFPAPQAEDDPRDDEAPIDQIYRLPSGALVRDASAPEDLSGPTIALIGTTAELNDGIKTLVYTPSTDDPNTPGDQRDYYYNGSNPESLDILMAPGDPNLPSGTNSWDVDIKVLDYNNFPEMTLNPTTTWDVASGGDVDMFDPGPDPLTDEPDVASVVVADEDNDDVIEDPNDGYIDGKGRQFLLAAWTTCGTFSIRREADFTIRDDLDAIFDEIWDRSVDSTSTPDTDKETVKEAFFEVLPDEVENLPFATENPDEPHKAFIGIANDIEELNWAMGHMTFHAEDKLGTPVASGTTCKLRVLVSDLGNNGLPLQYFGDPNTGAELPMFGVDLDTNYVPAVEEFTIDVDGGGPVTPTITSVSDVTLAEGTGGATTPFVFTLTLDAPAPAGGATVDVATSHTGAAPNTDDTDLAPIVATPVTFVEGATSATFTVPVDHDATVEPDEHFQIVLSNAVGVTIGDASGLGTVQNDDGPDAPPQIVTFTGDTHLEGDAATTSYEFDITLSEPAPAGGVAVRFSTSHGSTDGADLTTTSGQVVMFAEGQMTRTIIVGVNGDTDVEPTETFTAMLSNPDGLTIAAAAQSATGTITNDDFRTVSIGDVSMFEGDAGTTAFTFALTLDGPAVGGETVQVASGGGSATSPVDYMPLALVPVTFAPGATTADVTVNVNGDTDFEGDETFFATLVGPSNLLVGDGTGQGTILNDDAAPDVTDPTVTVNQGAAQPDPTTVSPIVFDVVFSEPVTGFETGDVTLGGTALPTTAVVTPISATTYTVAVSGMSQDGTVTATIGADVAVDAASNGNAASTSTDNTVTFDFDEGDVTDPTVTIDQGAAQSDPTTVSPIVFDVVFSELVTGFETGDVTLGGTALPTAAVVTPISATVYAVAVSGMSQDGTVIATIAMDVAVDAASNGNAASTSTDNTVTFDFDEGDVTDPTVTINQDAAQPDPTTVSPIEFDVVFSEPVIGFTDTDVDLSGTAMPTTALVSGSGATYTVSVSGMSVPGTVIATIPANVATDAAMNPNEASTSTDNEVTYLIDTTEPTVTIDQGSGQSDPTSVSPIVFDVQFSEPVTGFDDTDVTLSGTALPTMVMVSGSAANYTVSVSGMSQDGTVIAAIPAGAAVDASMNTSNASTSTDNQVTFDFDEGDVTDPTVTINQGAAQSDPTTVSPIVFDVVFSEPVTGFDDADVALSGTAMPTMAVVNGSGATYTVSVSGMSLDGTVIASVVAGAAMDSANNASLASTSTDNVVTYDDIEVQPPSPLTITVPADISVPNDPGQPGAIVSYPAPTTNGGVGPVTVTCSSPSGGFYPIGVTTVTCTATDSAPDQQQLALAVVSDSFTITVVDTVTPPTTTPPVTPPATPSSVTAPNVGDLPATGGDTRTPLVIAFGTCLVGLALLAARRRMRPVG